MKKYLALTLVLLLAACAAPADSLGSTSLPPAAAEGASPTAITEPSVAAPTATEVVQSVQLVPQATSRGDKLVASDPTTMQVGAGKPVLLEFFRFT